MPAQGTIYITVEIELEQFKAFTSDIDFVRALKLEENISVLPISILGKGYSGFRLLTCAKDDLYNTFFERLAGFVGRHRK